MSVPASTWIVESPSSVTGPRLLWPETFRIAPPVIPAVFQNLYVKSIRIGELDVLNDRLHLETLPRDPMIIVLGSNPGRLAGEDQVVRSGRVTWACLAFLSVAASGTRARSSWSGVGEVPPVVAQRADHEDVQ